MALNRRNYEHLYGSALFDELHNFFPELMYDEQIFPTEPFLWMRHRLHTLFPDIFTRQRTMYNIYHAEPRRAAYETWRFSSFPSVGVPTASRLSSPIRSRTVLIDPVVRIPPVRTPTTRTLNATVSNLLNTVWNEDTNGDSQLLRMLFGAAPMTDVPVVASSDVIASHSELVERNAVPADINCAVCQERNSDANWRKLNCSHYFHRTCIDPWFERNVHCPVCRHDIRTPFVPTPTS